MNKTYNIIEVANVHGGDGPYLLSLIKEFEEFNGNFGIKFQPFKYDEIATEDFEWYPVYKELFFSPNEWKEIFLEAKKTKDIWVDVFDSYSVKIIEENSSYISGLKFQTSVLGNRKLFRDLSKIDLSEKIIIINISGHSIEEIKNYAKRIERELSPKELILQVGFQNYPTDLNDSGLKKIEVLRREFRYRLSFTEHLDPENEESVRLPVAAVLLGADFIEKHVRHSFLETKYDFQSSIKIDGYRKYIDLLKSNLGSSFVDFANDRERELLGDNLKFISSNEAKYLKSTIQKPIADKDLHEGNLLSLCDDLSFKRSSQDGITIDKIEELISGFNIISNDKKKEKAFKELDFRKAKIATIIACRMKSTRLPKKAILPIGGISSIELCIKHALEFENADETILATSTDEDDAILKDYTYDESVIFYRGHPDNVIDRFLSVAKERDLDVIIRVTGDMQYVSNDIARILLKSHFETGADYTNGRHAAVGTNLEIINVFALKKVREYFPSADYSEYMSYYFWNNPKHFKLNFVDLPNDLVRDYRLTLDYPEDLEMFRKIEEYFSKNGIKYNLRMLFDFLDKNPDIAGINAECALKYKTDSKLISLLKGKTAIKD